MKNKTDKIAYTAAAGLLTIANAYLTFVAVKEAKDCGVAPVGFFGASTVFNGCSAILPWIEN